MKSGRNQKLTDTQISTIKYLKRNGFPTMTIARVTKSLYGVAFSTIYYHAAIVEAEDTRLIRETIRDLIFSGKCTREIAKEWGVPLATINRLYVGRRVV
jgi:hypothetical protein